MHFTFCPDCGEKLIGRVIGDEGEVPFCTVCNKPHFDNPYTCIITAAVNEYGEIALIKQSYVSSINHVLVAGYLKAGETAEETALREVFEELGIEPLSNRYLKSYFYEKKDMLMLGFITQVKKAAFKLSGEVDTAIWASYEEAIGLLRAGSIARQVVTDGREAGMI